MPNFKDVTSAGGVVWRSAQGRTEVCVVRRTKGPNGEFSLPKGGIHDGEHPIEAAVREVFEETRIVAVPQLRLRKQYYCAGERCVQYWSMFAKSEHGFETSESVVQRLWIPLSEVEHQLSRVHDRLAVTEFRSLPGVTASVLLVRAVKEFDGDRLSALAGRFSPDRLVAGGGKHCSSTLSRIAFTSGLDVVAWPEVTATRVRELIGGSAQPASTVICASQEETDRTVEELIGRKAMRRHGKTRRGQAWHLTFVDGDQSPRYLRAGIGLPSKRDDDW